MTDQGDRFCQRHYRPNALHAFLNFSCDLRWGTRRKCRHCEDEEYRQWQEDVARRFRFALEQAAHGLRMSWNPLPVSREKLVARMMELNEEPHTFEATVEWVRKYLGNGET